MRRKSRRWFLSWVAGLMIFLALALCFETILLMRRGMRPMQAQISGGSMEPHLAGPRLIYQNGSSGFVSSYSLDSMRPNMPISCPYTSERDNNFELLTALSLPGMSIDGDGVRYFLLRRMAALRAAGERGKFNYDAKDSYRGLLRGDIVVIQTPDEESREVKRIVGFPGETIDIVDGDLLINRRRWKRDVQQILEQSILLDYGDEQASSYWRYGGWYASGVQEGQRDGHNKVEGTKRVRFPVSLSAPISLSAPSIVSSTEDANFESIEKVVPFGGSMDFHLRSGGLITNELRWNAHDSHELVPVSDIGFAIRLDSEFRDWQMAVTIRSNDSVTVMVERQGDDVTVSTSQSEISKKLSHERQSHWLIFFKVDGEMIVADENAEWLREDSVGDPFDRDGSALEQDGVPFRVECHEGEFVIRDWVAFRDLHFRGVGDTPRQSLEARDGIVVLGDNVSLSEDSRQRWEEGLPFESVRGVVDLTDKGWGALIEQKSDFLFQKNKARLQEPE